MHPTSLGGRGCAPSQGPGTRLNAFVLKLSHLQMRFESIYNYQHLPLFLTHQDRKCEGPKGEILCDNVCVPRFLSEHN